MAPLGDARRSGAYHRADGRSALRKEIVVMGRRPLSEATIDDTQSGSSPTGAAGFPIPGSTAERDASLPLSGR
jgi:hypothetical protein